MAQLVGEATTKCPNSKVVVSGYSQGGQLVHNAATMLNATAAAKVSSGTQFHLETYSISPLYFSSVVRAGIKLTENVYPVVIFGDPNNGTAVAGIPASKTLIICHTGDDICAHGDQVLEPHLTVTPVLYPLLSCPIFCLSISDTGNSTPKTQQKQRIS